MYTNYETLERIKGVSLIDFIELIYDECCDFPSFLIDGKENNEINEYNYIELDNNILNKYITNIDVELNIITLEG